MTKVRYVFVTCNFLEIELVLECQVIEADLSEEVTQLQLAEKIQVCIGVYVTNTFTFSVVERNSEKRG